MRLSKLLKRIRDFDRTLFGMIFRVKWNPFTVVMRWLTLVGTAGALWGVLAAGAFLLTEWRPMHLLVPWGAVALSWLFAEGAKYLFNRARPSIRNTEIAPLVKTPSSSSFPSGHSATAAGGSLTLAAIYPDFVLALLLGGFLVALSRVYLGVHYPFDVLAGALIGTITAGALLVVAGAIA